MWLAHAGNRIDAPDRLEPRFPAANVPWFERRLRKFLGELRPDGIVSAAASGADLLILDVARELRIHTEIVLPLPIDEFVARSVADQGPEWVMRFERVLPDRSTAIVRDLSEHDDWYLRGNDEILTHALSVAGAEPVLAVAVRAAADPDKPSVTDDFAMRAKSRGLAVIDLDPSVRELPATPS